MRRRIYDNFFFLLLGLGFYGVARLLSPFADALIGAIICVVTFYPMYEKLSRWFPHPALRAAITEMLVVLFFLIPIVLLVWTSHNESTALLEMLRQGSSVFTRWRDGDTTVIPVVSHIRLLHHFGMNSGILKQDALIALNRVLEYLSSSSTLIFANMILFIVNILLMLFAMFFLFRDGEALCLYLQSLIPLRQEHKEHLMLRLRDAMIAVVRGGLLTAFLQGIAAGAGYFLAGVADPILLGCVTAVIGLVPIVGTFAVWGSVALYFLVKGALFKGVFVFLWGALIVAGLADMFVRPYLVGKRAHVPLFALFFALLGGMEVWGIKGMILGPILAVFMPELLTIYRLRYLRQE